MKKLIKNIKRIEMVIEKNNNFLIRKLSNWQMAKSSDFRKKYIKEVKPGNMTKYI